MTILVLVKKDGTRVDVHYRATPVQAQGVAVSRWLVTEGHRPSEAAMQVATMKPGKLRRMYQNLLLLGKITQDEVTK
jgi:hypothetical protein